MATVCKYFLNNSCRYGDRCHYSHVLPNDKYRSNPYVYNAKDKGGVSVMQRLSSPATSTPIKDDTDKVMQECWKRIAEEVNQIELQHMWPLTCYSLLKTGKNFPDWNDISMEEVRWEAYQAQANGTFPIYLSNMQELLSKAKELRHKLLKPNNETEALIKDLMKDNSSQSSPQNVPFFMNKQPTQAQANFSFASAFANKPQESVFNQATSPSNNSGIFARALQSSQQSPAQQSTFFGGKTSLNSTPVNNFFNSSTGHQSFSNVDMTTSSDDPFNQFGKQRDTNFGFQDSNSDENSIVYSKVENLTKEDYEAFKATAFTLENLPFVPPPKELCK
ncbi:hypothetical protein O3M35_012647 [Rhynocoris fuscipes]|uniref:Nucleoporin NUP42 n=1 Tax=Rhynocoris fuscipes TaxID=488301 RepID=A0AAW1CVL8_9HEMI